MIEKLILFENAVETLGYFSRQMAAAFEELGYRLFFVDFEDLNNSVRRVKKFAKMGTTALVTFNFIGLSGEEEFRGVDGRSIWEEYDIPCFCIMVDHPLYYYEQLQMGRGSLWTFCVDRGHVEYMRRFYPQIPCSFLPLAGNQLVGDQMAGNRMTGTQMMEVLGEPWIPFGRRKYDVAFIANYVVLPKMEEHFWGRTQEYIDFYREILAELRGEPDAAIDDVMERMILRDIPEVSPGEICSAEHGMAFLDLYNRSYYRETVVRSLVDAGVKVHVFGKDWDKLLCEHPENLIASGRMLTSAECVEVIRDSRIALNVMPWFKDGAHDRIFTAMLNGAVALTDGSRYLEEILVDGKDVCFYQLGELSELPEKIKRILADEKAAESLLEEAYLEAKEHHTWEMRAVELHQFITNHCNLKNDMLKWT